MHERTLTRHRIGLGVLALTAGWLAGCSTDAAPLSPPSAGTPNAAELRYVGDTGVAIYRTRAFERTRGFVFADAARGYGICLRAPMRDGRLDHTLLILQRRMDGGAVSQVEDDATILRASADIGPCRDRSDWVPAR